MLGWLLALGTPPTSLAQKVVPQRAASSSAQQRPDVGTCALGTAAKDLDGGDVRARLYNNGHLFWKGSGNVYTVPKEGAANAIFALGIWIGGLDTGGALRFAGTDYGPFEFWPGPLGSDGDPPAGCAPFDRIYKVSRGDIASYDANGSLTADLADWPAALGAPVTDGDGDPNNYDLEGGDRPALEGEQIAWWIMNDAGNVKQSSQTAPIGLEVHVAAHAYANDPNVADPSDPSRVVYPTTTVYDYTFIHRGDEPLSGTYAGVWADVDLGDPTNDFIGSDTTLHMGYVYNGGGLDGGSDGYGDFPPALGITLLETPEAPGTEGKLGSFLYYNGDSSVAGNPDCSTMECYNFLRSIWRDGTHVTYGGTGYGGQIPTSFMFSGRAEDREYWSEENVDGNGLRNTPADRRFVMGTPSFSFQPGETRHLRFAIVWAQGNDRLASLAELREHVAYVRDYEAGRTPSLGSDGSLLASPRLVSPPENASDVTLDPLLVWDAVAEAEAYEVELYTETGLSTSPAPLRAEDTQAQIRGLAPSTPFSWRVRAVPASGSPGRWSDRRSFTTSGEYGGETSGIGSFLVTANADGPLVPATGGAANFSGFPVPERPGDTQQVGEGTWLIATGERAGSPGTYEEFLVRAIRSGMHEVNPYDYEIRFTQACYDAWLATVGTRAAPSSDPYSYVGGLPASAPEGACWAYDRFGQLTESGDTPIIVPFEAWNIGPNTPDDTQDDVRLIPAAMDFEGDGFDLRAVDHAVSTGTNDPETDWIYLYQSESERGRVGYDRWVRDLINGQTPLSHGSEIMARLTFVNWNGGDVTASLFAPDQDMPEPGTIFRITSARTTKDFSATLTSLTAPSPYLGVDSATISLRFGETWQIEGSGTASAVTGVDVCETPACAAPVPLSFDLTDDGFTVGAAGNTNAALPETGDGLYVRVRTAGRPDGAIGGYARPAANRGPSAPGPITPSGYLDVSDSVALDVRFDRATDPDGNPLIYLWQLSTNPDFALGETLTARTSDDQTHQVSLAEIDDFLRSQGETRGGGTTLYHRVVASDWSVLTASETAALRLGDGTDEFPVALAVSSFYPNPVAETATLLLDAPLAASVRLEVYDMLGRRVIEREASIGQGYAQPMRLGVSGLASGVYLYRVEASSDGGEEAWAWQASGRFVVAR